MVAASNSVSTTAPDWQRKCWEWAEAKQPFEINNLATGHFMFCQELCAEYHYSYAYYCRGGESVARFKPRV